MPEPLLLNGTLIWVIDQGQTTPRQIYSSNQTLINCRTLLGPTLNAVPITHSRNTEETNNDIVGRGLPQPPGTGSGLGHRE